MNTETLVHEYAKVWSPIDAETRRALLEKVWTEDCVYQDPSDRVAGRGPFAAHLATFQAQYPGTRFDCHNVISHHGWVFFEWKMVTPGEVVAMHGRSCGRLDADGVRFTEIAGFFEPPA
ncbi:MAG: nuclear transport factor 2 family protein [Myxococcota bacterium]